MYKGQKIIVVMPAYNAAATLERTVAEIPEMVDEKILVDDGSGDNTAELASRLGLMVIKHETNRGYGANQKTCYQAALEKGADIIVMLHPDYQYDPRLIKYLVEFIADDHFDLVLASRIRSRREALAGGMPVYKYYSNRFLTFFENVLSGYNLSEWHTGMRAYHRRVLENIAWQDNSSDFIFDTHVLFQAVSRAYRIGDIPAPVRYFPEASSINFWRSLKYGLGTLGIALTYFFRRKI